MQTVLQEDGAGSKVGEWTIDRLGKYDGILTSTKGSWEVSGDEFYMGRPSMDTGFPPPVLSSMHVRPYKVESWIKTRIRLLSRKYN